MEDASLETTLRQFGEEVFDCVELAPRLFIRALKDRPLTSHGSKSLVRMKSSLSIGIKREDPMSNSVYKIIELVGTSTKSWDDAARAAVERASSSLRDLRIAEVVKLDLQIKDGKVEAYRAKVSVSFKYEDKA